MDKNEKKRKPKKPSVGTNNSNISGPAEIQEPKGFTKRKPQKNKEKKSSESNINFKSEPIKIKKSSNHESDSGRSPSEKLSWDKNPVYMSTSNDKSNQFERNKKQFKTDKNRTSYSSFSKDNFKNQEHSRNNWPVRSQSSSHYDRNFKYSSQIVDPEIVELEDQIEEKKVDIPVVYIDDREDFFDEREIEEFNMDDLPPLFSDIESNLEELHVGGLEELSIHDFAKHMTFWRAKKQTDDLFDISMAPDTSTLEAKRNPISGELIEFCEVPICNQELTAKNSMSWERAPDPFDEENITGHANNKPFWPGGFSEPDNDFGNEDLEQVDFKHNLLVDAPGYYGINFMSDGRTLQEWDRSRVEGNFHIGKQIRISNDEEDDGDNDSINLPEESIINLLTCTDQNDFNFNEGLWENDSQVEQEVSPSEQAVQTFPTNEQEDDVIPHEIDIPILKISTAVTKQLTKTEWAELLDVSKPVLDFDTKVPIMAHTWPFQLDIFQKQAIIKLEEHNHVFVTAHTSAGKTVIAEYAIALSQNHKTRTIYTSPIKALSNQKYRDFKDTFQDVGLVTGDFQINTTASCLIMTTEILKSMLYRGSDVLRDLEYVIFDEVHYINDSERGHVWEETLILLPKEVCIVMLSATVPNTMEFADWVGCTKKTKVYVVSTLKRPVPLQHYLYVGPVPDKKQLYLIRDAEGDFLSKGYLSAKDGKSRRNESGRSGGGGNRGQLSRGAEKNLFISFLNYLNKNQNLPVVIFTLSRKRCDQNAENLLSMDFTTSTEKSKIHRFFNDSIKNLQNEDDRNLPQVKRLDQLLKNGIGVHHSGILPILKEIVEMLFQKGLVKILFATETFAMGVNMPARTVAFDSIRKYDGSEDRNLNPAEYIQMAGRAGRRGLDENGTVIIMCKESLPSQEELKAMMLGKQTKLESQFRLTYSMILNLMRVSMVNVEEMMSMSFKEFGFRFVNQKNKEALALLEDECRLKNLELNQEGDGLYEKFFDEAKKFFDIKCSFMSLVEKTPEFKSTIVPGIVMHIWTQEYRDKLALLCKIDPRKSVYRVLIFTDGEESKPKQGAEPRPSLYYQMLYLLTSDVLPFHNLTANHAVINIKVQDILSVITASPLKVNLDTAVNNWDLRQTPRFRETPISDSMQVALNYLYEIYIDLFQSTEKRFKPVNIYQCIKISLLNINDQLVELRNQDVEVQKYVNIIRQNNSVVDPDMFYNIFKRKENNDKQLELRRLLSTQNMSLYGDYDAKVKVLEDLNYINGQRIVQLKGNVACEMGNNSELLITELLFQNKLVNFSPEEIAALLSCLVFKAKTTIEPMLPDSLQMGRKIIEDLHESISLTEKKYLVEKDKNSEGEKLNFGLMRVVYEWAMQKPFKDIMTLTDVQEGIIVRCIQQLVELLSSIKDGAKIFGERDLPLKMDQAIQVIKRDIVFAPSLYTT